MLSLTQFLANLILTSVSIAVRLLLVHRKFPNDSYAAAATPR